MGISDRSFVKWKWDLKVWSRIKCQGNEACSVSNLSEKDFITVEGIQLLTRSEEVTD